MNGTNATNATRVINGTCGAPVCWEFGAFASAANGSQRLLLLVFNIQSRKGARF